MSAWRHPVWGRHRPELAVQRSTNNGFRSRLRAPMYPYVAPHTSKIHTLITLGIGIRTKPLDLKARKRLPYGFDSHRPLQFSLSGVSLRCPRARPSSSSSSHSLDVDTASSLFQSADRPLDQVRSQWSHPAAIGPEPSNPGRFPADFMFQLAVEESASLRSQSGALKTGRGRHRKYAPYVFTEQGIAMLSSVLTGERAVQVNMPSMTSQYRRIKTCLIVIGLTVRLPAL
jgi:hypothetical protein